MAGRVIANGPISFTDGEGRAFAIPLSLLSFNDQGQLLYDEWPHDEHSGLLDLWLPYWQKQGMIREGAEPPRGQAMIITAQDAGAAGNTILLDIQNVRPDPADAAITIFDATVTETNSYPGLTPESLKEVIGEEAGGGTKPGLVFVSSTGDPVLPKAGDYPLADGGADASSVDIPTPDDSAIAFSLDARKAGAEGDNITVTISDVDEVASTFTLVAVWNKEATGLEADELEATFAFEIAVDPPASGELAAPAAGEYLLRNGSDIQSAVSASATLPAAP
jgi:hypothetical protein